MDDVEVIAQYLALLAHLGFRPSTIKARRWALLRVVRAGGLLTATEQLIYRLVSQPTMGADARANLLGHLRAFFRYAARAGLVAVDPTLNLESPRRKRHLPRPMPEGELRMALDMAQDPIRSWLYLAAYGGLRCCEIAPLKGTDRSGDLLIIREQKGGEPGVIPVGPVLDQAIAHLPARGWWFERWDGKGGPISANQLQRHGNRFLHDIGIEHTMHSLRHRFGSRIYEASGRDLMLTRELMRHKSVVSTTGYVEIDQQRGASVVAQLA